MSNRKRQRIKIILLGLGLLISSAVLVGYGMRDGIEFFKSPAQLLEKPPLVGQRFRIGGLVKENTVKTLNDGLVEFEVFDSVASIEVRFKGILPDLFSEGKGVIASGFIGDDRIFYANEVLAKHDENYMPKEIVDTLKQQGIFIEPVQK